MIQRDVAKPQSDLLGASDAQTLALFEYLHEMARFDKGSVGAGVEPGKTATKNLNMQICLFQDKQRFTSVISSSPRTDGFN